MAHQPSPAAQAILQLLAARHVLAMLPTEDMPRCAVELLEAGVESEAFANLAGAIELDHPADLHKLFEDGLAECAVRAPSRLDAAAQLKLHIANQVVTGAIAPAAGCMRIVELFQAIGAELPRSKGYVGEAFGIGRLYGLWDSLVELPRGDESLRQSIELEILDECLAIAATAMPPTASARTSST